MGAYAASLRQELAARALDLAQRQSILHECSIGSVPAVVFREDDAGAHGNFFPASYRRIRTRPEWNRRLRKAHTSARRCLVSHDRERRELDTATSSDALLMSVFCHPQAFAAGLSLRALLATQPPERLQFGYKPRIPLRNNHVERTEIDLRIGSLLIEAKLTEHDFQTAPRSRVENYRDAATVFDLDALPCRDQVLLHYQLIRGVLAASAEANNRYCVITDARRPDLIDAWCAVMRAIRPYGLRSRVQVVTWQEIAAAVPRSLQTWLAEKYGIVTY